MHTSHYSRVGKPTIPLATQERLYTYILHVVSITAHTHDRRKSIGEKKQSFIFPHPPEDENEEKKKKQRKEGRMKEIKEERRKQKKKTKKERKGKKRKDKKARKDKKDKA